MSLNTILQQNDSGVTFLITVVEEDGKTPQDISNATSMFVCITKSDGIVVNGVANWVTDGINGQMFYITQANDLNVVGVYRIQGRWYVSANVFYTATAQFLVQSNC